MSRFLGLHFLVGFFVCFWGGSETRFLALASSSVTGTFLFARYTQLSETPVQKGKGRGKRKRRRKSYSSHFFGTENHGHTLAPAGYPCPSLNGCTLRPFANGDESGRRRGPGLGERTVHLHPSASCCRARNQYDVHCCASLAVGMFAKRSCMRVPIPTSAFPGRGGLFGKHRSEVD